MNKSVDKINEQGQSDLHIAVLDNNISVAKTLIADQADVNLKDNQANSPYLLACKLGRYEILKAMIKNSNIDYSIRDQEGRSGLISAVKAGHLKSVQLLLKEAKEDIDNQDNQGYTALVNIVILNNRDAVYPKIADLLIKAGANAGLQDKKYKTVIQYAKELDYTEIIELLLSSRSAYVNF